MAQTISPIQVYYPKSWSGLTTENHLSAVFADEPQLISDAVTKVFGNQVYKGLNYLLTKVGTKEMPTDNDYEWLLKGDDRKAVRIVSYSATDTTKPGLNKTLFTVELEEKYFAYTDLLIFDDRDYQVRVMEEPTPNGSNWQYKVQLMTNDSSKFVPVAYLAAGKQVSKLWSPQERTLNKTYGQTSFSSPFKMRNLFSTFSKEYVVPGNMHQRPMVIKFTDPNSGATTNVWTKYADWEFMCQWEREKDNNLIYSTFNQNTDGTFDMKGASGFPIIQGAGLRQQISPAYKFYYSTFTIDYLLEVLLNLSINILPEDSREFVLMTGERGMIQFHKALENKVALFQPFGNPARLAGSGQNLRFQGQYVEYWGPQGVKVTVMAIPQYDDIIDNRIPHPDGGFTENYRYTILNFGTTGGEANIVKVYPKGRRDIMAYVPGTTSPMGPGTSFSSMAASKVDGYELVCQTTQGIMIKNPMSCAELIYSATA